MLKSCNFLFGHISILLLDFLILNSKKNMEVLLWEKLMNDYLLKTQDWRLCTTQLNLKHLKKSENLLITFALEKFFLNIRSVRIVVVSVWFHESDFGFSIWLFVLVSLKCGCLICLDLIQILVSVSKWIHRKMKPV